MRRAVLEIPAQTRRRRTFADASSSSTASKYVPPEVTLGREGKARPEGSASAAKGRQLICLDPLQEKQRASSQLLLARAVVSAGHFRACTGRTRDLGHCSAKGADKLAPYRARPFAPPE